MSAKLGKLLVLQGGGPSPVLNASLFAVIDEAARSGRFEQVLGARFGVEGLVKGDFVDLSAVCAKELLKMRSSPGASLGATRYKPSQVEMDGIVSSLISKGVRSLLLIGGNGSMRCAAALDGAAREAKADLCVIGIPKTIDNDIVGTDRCPGYGSAARYVAQAVRDLGMDVRTLPQPVSIFETMGRNAGWLAAASVLGRIDEGHSPHLVYLPERAFDVDAFIGDLDRVVRKNGWAVVVVSEGITNAKGEPVYQTSDASQRDALNRAMPGGVAGYLAQVVTEKLKIRCRSEKPGLCGRSSALHVSQVDRADAELVGRRAVDTAIARVSGRMVSLLPLRGAGDVGRCELVSLDEVHGERAFPSEWMTGDNSTLAPAFIEYASRIVGELVDYAVPLHAVSKRD